MVDRILTLIKQKGLSVSAVEKKLGFGNGAIKRFSTNSPSIDKVIAISNFLNVSVDYLLFGKEHTENISEDTNKLLSYYEILSDMDKGIVLGKAETLAELAAERAEQERAAAEKQKCIALPVFLESNTEENTIDINFYDMPSSAGTGIFLDHTHYERRKIRRTAEAERADFAIPITGDSMEPVFHSGDVVLVESCPYVREGEIGIFVLDGDAFIKKYDGNRLLSLNPQYEPIELSKYETAVCLGRVLGIAELL